MRHISFSLLDTSHQTNTLKTMISNDPGGEASSSSKSAPAPAAADPLPPPPPPLPQLSRYESQKRRDWNTFGQYLRNHRPPITLSQCHHSHVLEFMQYLDQFGKTKVHVHECGFFGQPDPAGPCDCPLKQAWGSLDALVGRLRAAYEENGGSQESNPFANGAIRFYLREVRDSQAKARGIQYKKKKKKKRKQREVTISSVSSAMHKAAGI